jgi:molybdenum cofactor synthesis domain-containing protein
MNSDRRPRAGVIIIGDEVLGGKVSDQNTPFFIDRFKRLGVTLARVTIIGDHAEEITATVREFSNRYDIVCTTGGIGPTHDDLTIAAVADAFSVSLVEHPDLVDRMQAYLKAPPTEAHRRLTRVPEGCQLETTAEGHWPVLRHENVYIFPGVPRLLQKKFDSIQHHFAGRALYGGALMLEGDEASLCAQLEDVVRRHPDASIGSYPSIHEGTWSLRLTVDASDQHTATQALDDLERTLQSRVTGREEVRESTSPPT